MIEGELLTTRAVAERLGVTPAAARARLAKARKKDGPVTWEKLR